MSEELLRVLARFITKTGKHDEWCNVVTSNMSCSCGYGEIFSVANKFLKSPKDDDFIRLARSVEVIQNQMDRILVILEKLILTKREESANE